MYEHHWKFQKAPFKHDRSEASFFMGRSHHNALLKLQYLIEHRQGLGLLVGISGSGKSRLLDAIVHQPHFSTWPVARVVYPQMSSIELLSYIAGALTLDEALPTQPSMDIVLRNLENSFVRLTAEGRPPIILIDDAHTISDRQVLRSLQLLLNFQQPDRIDFTLILVGQPELVGVVRRVPELDDRIVVPCVLQSLTAEETTGYIRQRLIAAGATQQIFSDEAMSAVHELSSGLPRRINRLCDFALLVGYAQNLDAIGIDQIEGLSAELNLSRAA